MSTYEQDNLFWRVGDSLPDDLETDPFTSVMIPKPTAWFSSNEKDVALVEGYSVANHAPPTLMMAAEALSPAMLIDLRKSGFATLSVATLREKHCLFKASNPDGQSRPINFTFDALGITPDSTKVDRPPAVKSSPIKMYCKILEIIALGNGQQMVLLEVESCSISKCVLSKPDEGSTRKTLAKIDAILIQAVASFGCGQFATMDNLRHMPRPEQCEGTWKSDPFALLQPTFGSANYPDLEYVFHNDHSNLGYNPIKAIVIPRPIGWISTYADESKAITHVAPYSFFTDVGRGSRPMVAFSSYRSASADHGGRKDAQLDTETSGSFCVNIVSEELAVPMNFTSGELKRHESEFEVAGLNHSHACMVNAPFVDQAHIVMEGRYIKTVDVGSYSIVIGEIVGIRLNKRILSDGKVDATKVMPVTRLGFDEYAVISRYVEHVPSLPNHQNQCP